MSSYLSVATRANALRWSIAILAILGGMLVSGSGRADSAARAEPLRVLFIGNSQTSTNDLPAFVAAMARKSKHAAVEYRTIAPSAVTLENHWKTGTPIPALTGQQWDAVVMQQGPSVLPGGRARLCHYARLFADEARARGARPYLLMVWPRDHSPVEQVIDSYAAAAAASGSTLIPAGAAWGAAWRRKPELALHAWDGIHPSGLGTYLAALVVYAGLRGALPAAPTSLVVSGKLFWITRGTARLLRESAAEALATRFPASAC